MPINAPEGYLIDYCALFVFTRRGYAVLPGVDIRCHAC
jgi:hypothetical protein